MNRILNCAALAASVALLATVSATRVMSHGPVTPQVLDMSALPDIGDAWLTKNPYRGNPTAIKLGEFAYGQNCARCHGLEAISGGIAPDLRYLDVGEAGDEWFINRFHHGSSHDGKVYMPPLGDILGQKQGWAIRSWLDMKHTDE